MHPELRPREVIYEDDCDTCSFNTSTF